MSSEHHQQISDAVWRWRDAAADKHVPQKGKSLRAKALRQAAIMACIGLAVFFLLHHRAMAYAVWVLTAVVLVSGLWIPPVFKAIESFGAWLGKIVATGLTWALLAPLYYTVFLAGHLVLLVTGKDPMHREFPSKEPTYWVPRKPARNLEQYTKQH
ncbi:MAG: hypothetical protein JXB04_09465 [Kiritimatiellae bacterium]|nr:hypothetical protein [Kiritimatiellia bacterium]